MGTRPGMDDAETFELIEPVFNCDCGSTFDSYNAIICHRSKAAQHKPWHAKSQTQGPGICICGAVFDDDRSLQRHVSKQLRDLEKEDKAGKKAEALTRVVDQPKVSVAGSNCNVPAKSKADPEQAPPQNAPLPKKYESVKAHCRETPNGFYKPSFTGEVAEKQTGSEGSRGQT